MFNPFLIESGAWSKGCSVETSGAHTGHFVHSIAYCNTPETAAALALGPDLIRAANGILQLIGNVDHSKGNGPNAAEMRGGMLNDIRAILLVALPQDAAK